MGQQQLLLLVLSAIIVGISIVIGINMFSSGAVQANQDAVAQDCWLIAARAQEWYRKAENLGGGGRTFDGLDDVTMLNIAETNPNVSEIFALTPSDQTLEIVGTGIEGGPLTVTVIVTPDSIRSTDFTP